MDNNSCSPSDHDNYMKYLEVSGFSAFSFILGAIIAKCCLKRLSIQ